MKPTPIRPTETPQEWAKRVLKRLEANKARGRKRAVDAAAASRPRSGARTAPTPAPRHINAVKRGECEWCGQPADGGECWEHDDLRQFDPRYNPEAARRTG